MTTVGTVESLRGYGKLIEVKILPEMGHIQIDEFTREEHTGTVILEPEYLQGLIGLLQSAYAEAVPTRIQYLDANHPNWRQDLPAIDALLEVVP